MSLTKPNSATAANQRPLALLPLAADALSIAVHLLLIVPFLTGRFNRTVVDYDALVDATYFVLFYFVFLAGLNAIGKRPTHPDGQALATPFANRPLLALLAIPIGAFIVLAIADLSGFLDLIFDIEFGEVGNAYYALITPALYAFFGLLYFFILITDRSRIEPRTPSPYNLLDLMAVNLFIGVAAVYLRSNDYSPIMTVVVMLLLLLPRILFATKRPHSVLVLLPLAQLYFLLYALNLI